MFPPEYRALVFVGQRHQLKSTAITSSKITKNTDAQQVLVRPRVSEAVAPRTNFNEIIDTDKLKMACELDGSSDPNLNLIKLIQYCLYQ